MIKNDIIEYIRIISNEHGVKESTIAAACKIIRDSDVSRLDQAVASAGSLLGLSLFS
jgi:hypothetical protein